MVVGDAHQMIYSWREVSHSPPTTPLTTHHSPRAHHSLLPPQANPANLASLAAALGLPRQLCLTRNYRSTPQTSRSRAPRSPRPSSPPRAPPTAPAAARWRRRRRARRRRRRRRCGHRRRAARRWRCIFTRRPRTRRRASRYTSRGCCGAAAAGCARRTSLFSVAPPTCARRSPPRSSAADSPASRRRPGGGRGASAEGDVADALAHLALLVVDAARAQRPSRASPPPSAASGRREDATSTRLRRRASPRWPIRIAAGNMTCAGVPATGEARDALRPLQRRMRRQGPSRRRRARPTSSTSERAARRRRRRRRCALPGALRPSRERSAADANGSSADRAASVRAFVASLPLGASLLDDVAPAARRAAAA